MGDLWDLPAPGLKPSIKGPPSALVISNDTGFGMSFEAASSRVMSSNHPLPVPTPKATPLTATIKKTKNNVNLRIQKSPAYFNCIARMPNRKDGHNRHERPRPLFQLALATYGQRSLSFLFAVRRDLLFLFFALFLF